MHLLTAAHYSRVYVFAPVADESDAAQQNVAARLKEESTSRPATLRQASTIALAKPPTTLPPVVHRHRPLRSL